ncbi:hypothetical protein ETB97_003997 [Aspergillus alliaceus]|uniref:Pyridoxal phosphate-dependent transferase n=1 Tax=Petromyces alliaceus TaxID=209559 RepID=A0A5N6G0U3_PETAA|nr:pyridoxal phosphate-dependent transferase [Aspergillus alliaceus]KAB8234780.1 pyridoxal phosphate-dependent transferase [Aspergillus alliaceus]KAE8384798.1 pyridoxal phosphate-dependent transferase [Aspergillus alliaceus]KAF5867077.1 hypothetical protein ETB97_003997 [Aspergillus burnettii]
MSLPRAFSEDLNAGLNKCRQQRLYLQTSPSPDGSSVVDFSSNDSLALRSSEALRKEFFRQLGQRPLYLGAGSSRVLDGSSKQVMELEARLAAYHGAKDGLLFNSGYEANVAIFSNLPHPGDAIVYDNLIHASIIDGSQASQATIVRSFKHNDVHSLRQVLENIKAESLDIVEGRRTVFVSFESFYSMDGDVAPIRDILDIVKQALPAGNFVFIIDEAHSVGLIGPHGSGLAAHLGLEKELHIQMQCYTKAPGASCGIVLCDSLVRQFLVNYARSLIYSTGPTFPTVALLNASINILKSSEGDRRREQLHNNIKLFYDTIAKQTQWEMVQHSGVLRIPTMRSSDVVRYNVPIVPLVTAVGLCHNLQAWLLRCGYRTYAFTFPVVPRTKERVRLMLNAEHTPEQIFNAVQALMVWAERHLLFNKGSRL